MKNEEKAKEIAEKNAIIYDAEEDTANGLIYPTIHSAKECEKSALEIAEWKDELPISELGGWNTEEPTEDGWYLVDTPDFPKNCRCIVAEWDSHAERFYSEAHDHAIDFNKWKLIERSIK